MKVTMCQNCKYCQYLENWPNKYAQRHWYHFCAKWQIDVIKVKRSQYHRCGGKYIKEKENA